MEKRISWICFCALISAAVISVSHIGSKVVTVMSERTPIIREHTLIIDAGHGGEDGGTSSPDGIPESTYNLSIALRLEKLLQLLGQETRMVRSSDISVYTEGTTLAQKKRSDLKARVGLVNSTNNALLLSIHQNNYPDGRYHGAQVFYAGTEGSKPLAADLQNAFCRTLNPGNSREIKPASGIYLMEHIQRPGVLIECGFLSNPQEAQLLKDSEYQKKLACVIAATVKSHLDETEKPNT